MKRENSARIDAAEALALLELIEAQEEARRRPLNEDLYFKYLLSAAGENNPDEEVWMNSRTEPAAHFLPPPPLSMAKYSPYDNYYGRQNGGAAAAAAKRFMVAKRKKRDFRPRLG